MSLKVATWNTAFWSHKSARANDQAWFSTSSSRHRGRGATSARVSEEATAVAKVDAVLAVRHTHDENTASPSAGYAAVGNAY